MQIVGIDYSRGSDYSVIVLLEKLQDGSYKVTSIEERQAMNRADLLDQAKKLTCGDRNDAYGPPFDNLTNIAGLFTAYLIGKYGGVILDPLQFVLTAEDIAHFNVLQKMARSWRETSPRPDTYIDMAAYAAIAGECASLEAEE